MPCPSTSAARTQIAEIDSTAAEPLPWCVQVPGAACSISTHRLVTFTGRRFLNDFLLAPPSQHTSAAPHSDAAVAHSALDPAASVEQDSSKGAPDCGCECSATGRRDSANEQPSSSDDSPGFKLLFALMNGDAPSSVSVAEVVQLVQAAKYALADDVIAVLPAYLVTGTQAHQTPIAQVRICSGACQSSVLACVKGDRTGQADVLAMTCMR